jgi:hypothetical protein
MAQPATLQRRHTLKNSTLSMKVFAGYLAALSALLLFRPSLLLTLGFENIASPWVPTLGYIVGALAFFYFTAVRENAKNFYAWSVRARLPLVLFFGILFFLGKAPLIMLIIGVFDTSCALWTGFALRHENAP